ncbi:bifunctional transcriptional activator/DNA repair enzyme AdaA [Kineococcus gynurae]|uniref:Bifunctional transcriptional activator/DNA repair enzyme AdaA n=1 Tax=Kineococcus gynurae TaxID=452979 RepID=A0ABV5LTU9_9ACTN
MPLLAPPDPVPTVELTDDRWDAVVNRSTGPHDFLFAVRTTGIYCRPGCPARTPLRRNVIAVADPGAAELAGFRACRRCHPDAGLGTDGGEVDRARVVEACRAMDEAGGPVPVADLAVRTGWSPRHLQRRFAELTGTTPRAYGETVRAARLRPALRADGGVLDAAFTVGYGSVRAFYEQGAARLGMTPSAFAAGGRGERLLYAVTDLDLPVDRPADGPTNLGADPTGGSARLLVVVSFAGVVAVRLGPDGEALLAEVRAELPAAEFERADDALADVVGGLRRLAAGAAAPALPLDVRGTAFQARVWAALRRIPAGEVRSYAEVAVELGRPSAVRAVAGACARNPAALLTPCHRVLRSDGGLGGFRWGLAVKEELLAREDAAGHEDVPGPRPPR